MSSLELVSTLPFNNSCTFPNDILTQLYLYTAWIQLHQCRILEPNNLNYSVFSDSVYHFPANVSFLCVALLIYIPEVTSRPSSPNGMFPVVPIAVSVAVGAVLVIAAIIVVICCCRRRANVQDNTSAECSNPVRDSYVVPGKCSLANCLFTNRFRYVVFTAHTFQIVFYRCMVNKDFD